MAHVGKLAKRTAKWFGDIQCGWCGERIAGRDSYNGDGRYYLYFEEGWHFREADAVWAYTKRAMQRLKNGRRPAVRHQYALSWGAAGADDTKHTAVIFAVGDSVEIVPRALPLRAQCPYCGGFQTLDPEVLDVDNSGPW